MTNPRDKREARKEATYDATRRATKHKVGFDSTVLKLPPDVANYKPKKGTDRLEILPFILSKNITKFHPDIQEHSGSPGEPHFEQSFFVHPRMGINEDAIVCPRKTFNKPCPICEERARLSKDPGADKEEIKALNPKERQAFVIINHAEAAKGPQVLEFSFHNFGKLLDARVTKSEPNSPRRFFYHPTKGSTLTVEWDEASGGGYKFIEASAIDFDARKKALSPAWLKDVVCLTDCIKELTYQEIKKIFLAVEPDEELPEDETAAEPEAEAGEVDQTEPLETAIEWEVGHECEFDYNGETLKGTISKINDQRGLVMVAVEGQAKDSVVKKDELRIVQEEAADEGWGDAEEGGEADEGWGTEEEAAEPEAEAEAPADDSGWDDAGTEEAGDGASGWEDDTPAEPEPPKKATPKKAAPAPVAKKPAPAPAAAKKPAPAPAKKPAAKK